MPWCKKKHRIEFLDDLTDVETPSPNEGEVLTFVGDRWESKPPAGILPEPGAAGEILTSTGTEWVSSPMEAVAPFFVECLTDPAVSGWSQSTAGTGQFGSVSGTLSDHPGQWFLSAGVGSTSPSRTTFYL